MNSCNMILTEKQQKDQLGDEYLTGEEILPSNQRLITEQDRFAYSPLGKAFKKQIKQVGAIKPLGLGL